MIPRKINRYGWHPSLPDIRDFKYKLSEPVKLPASVDLRSKCPIIYNQGEIGSCTGNALAAAYEYKVMQEGKKDFMPSRLFIYYCERALEGTTGSDSGASIRDGLISLNKQGVCSEDIWQYIVNQLTIQPNADCYVQALKNKIGLYENLDNTNTFLIKQVLAKDNIIPCGFTVFESFETDDVSNTGIVPMPNFNSENILGGHAVDIVGYDDNTQRYLGRNSWGKDWGLNGYFTVPYEYFSNLTLASDFYLIDAV